VQNRRQPNPPLPRRNPDGGGKFHLPGAPQVDASGGSF
jgi:hypothetical protein